MKALPLLAALAATTPAAAQQALLPSPFALHRGTDSCSVGRAPGNRSASAVTIGHGIDGRVWARVSGRGWRFAPEVTYRIRIRDAVEGPASEAAAEARGFRDRNGWTGIAFAPGSVPGPLFSAQNVALLREGEAQPFAVLLNPYIESAGWLRGCIRELARSDLGSRKPAATPPQPRGDPRRFVTDDDYPPAALRAEERGTVVARLTLSAHGIVIDCRVLEPSGSAILDRTTCALLSRRARFTGALDAEGKPTASAFDIRFAWVLPE